MKKQTVPSHTVSFLDREYLESYNTLVGVRCGNMIYVDKAKYSVTTTRALNRWLRDWYGMSKPNPTRVSNTELVRIAVTGSYNQPTKKEETLE